MHFSGMEFKTLPIPFSVFKAVGKIDDCRYLLGDHLGKLSVLVLRYDEPPTIPLFTAL